MRSLKLVIVLLIFASSASASTTLYWKQFQNSFSTATAYKYMTPVRSVLAGVDIATTSTAGGTNIQLTATAGGAAVAWISPPVASAFTLSGTVTFNFWGREAANANNASFRGRLYIYSGGVEGAAICTAEVSTELTTTNSNKSATCTPSSTGVAIGDRIVAKGFLENCATSGCPAGTMGAGTVNLNYGGATGAAAGDVFVTLTENVTFQNEAEFVQMVQQYTASGTTQNIALPGAVTAGSGIVFLCGWTTAANDCTPTDSRSNSYTSLAVKANWNGAAQTDHFFYACNAAAGSTTFTLTINGASTNLSTTVAEYTGLDTSCFDATATTNNTGSSTTPASNAFSTVAANTIVIGGENGNFGVTTTPGANYVLRSSATSPTTHTLEDRAITAAGSQTPGVTLSGSLAWLMSGLSFKGGTQPTPPSGCSGSRLLLMGAGC